MRMDTSVMADSEEAKFAAKRRLGRMLWQQYPNVRYLETLGLKMPKKLASEFEAARPLRIYVPISLSLSASCTRFPIRSWSRLPWLARPTRSPDRRKILLRPELTRYAFTRCPPRAKRLMT